MEKQRMSVIKICTNPDIKSRVIQLYEKECRPLKETAAMIGCSNNTMMVALGVLGYPYEPFFKERVETQKLKVKKALEKRKKNG